MLCTDAQGSTLHSGERRGSSMITSRRAASRQARVPAVLAGVLLLTGCAASRRALPTLTPWPTPIVSVKPTYKVQRGTVVDRFDLTGQVVPVTWESLFFTVDGRLAGLNVAEGSQVEAGDILAELEMKTLDEQLAQAQLTLEQAQDQLAQAESERHYALERARLQLRVQELILKQLRQNLEEARPLQQQEATVNLERARVELEKAQAAYDAIDWKPGAQASPQAAALQEASFDYQLAEIRYKLSTLSDDDTAVALQEIEVGLAQLAIEELGASGDPNLERTIAKAKIEIESLKRQMEERRLRAPYDGQVVAVGLNVQGVDGAGAAPLRVGDSVPAYSVLIAVARPDELEIVVSVKERRAADLAVGQVVTVTHRLARDRPFQARVVAMPVQQLGDRMQGSTAQVVRITLPKDMVRASIGDFVEIAAVNDLHEDVLFLPPAAIRRFSGRIFAVVQEGGRQRRVDLAPGLETPNQIEILSGLREGDVVVGP
jgi:multidrug efflux pump subunit AcrA (membrane-fusion protein)